MADIINPILSEEDVIPGDGPLPEKEALYSAGRLVEEYFERKNKQPQLSEREIQEQLEGDFKLSMEITEKMIEKLKSKDIEVIYVYWRFNFLEDYDLMLVINENDYHDYDRVTDCYKLADEILNEYNNPKFDLGIGFIPKTIHFDSDAIFYDEYKLIYDKER